MSQNFSSAKKTETAEFFTVYGKQPVIEALRSSYKIKQIYLSRDMHAKTAGYIQALAAEKKIPLQQVHKNDIQKLSGPVVHQGVALQMEALKTGSLYNLEVILKEKEAPFFMILDQVQDPHNMGAILRTAEICAVDAVILPQKGSAALNETVAKTSAGALFHLNIILAEHLESVLDMLHTAAVNTLALMPGSENTMYEKNLKEGVAIIVGSEGTGVRKNIARLCSGRITIPQYGKIDSLNASVAAAVVLYEVIRQRIE